MKFTLPNWQEFEIEGDSMSQDDATNLIEQISQWFTTQIEELKTDYEKKLNKSGFEARKANKTATDATSMAEDALAQFNELKAKNEFIKLHPWADFEAVESIRTDNPNLTFEEANLLAMRRKSYGMEWIERKDGFQMSYTNEEFAKLSETEQDKVLDLAQAGQVSLDAK